MKNMFVWLFGKLVAHIMAFNLSGPMGQEA